MSAVKGNVKKAATSRRSPQQKNASRQQAYLHRISTRCIDSFEDAHDVVGLMHERETDTLRISELYLDENYF